jgi:hypothetical protein
MSQHETGGHVTTSTKLKLLKIYKLSFIHVHQIKSKISIIQYSGTPLYRAIHCIDIFTNL